MTGMNERIRTKFQRVFNRKFNKMEIVIFTSGYAVQVSSLNASKLFQIWAPLTGLTPWIKFPNKPRYKISTSHREKRGERQLKKY